MLPRAMGDVMGFVAWVFVSGVGASAGNGMRVVAIVLCYCTLANNTAKKKNAQTVGASSSKKVFKGKAALLLRQYK